MTQLEDEVVKRQRERARLMAWLLGEDTSLAAGSAVVLVASTATPGSGPNLLEVHRTPAEESPER